MSTRFYDTDLADAAWSWVAPVLPAARQGGRPRTIDLRAVLNAIFYFCGQAVGQAANGDYCHANFHLGAGSTITFRPGKMPVCGFIYTACSTLKSPSTLHQMIHLHRDQADVLAKASPASGRTRMVRRS